MIDPATLTGRWRPFEDRAIFRLSGPDRVRFLNGQVTNDVRKVSPQRSLPACLCSIKGKVEALIWIADLGESLLIDGELDQADWIGQRLDRYLIADDCELLEETGQWQLIHHFLPETGEPSSRRLAIPGFDRWISQEGAAETERFAVDRVINDAEWDLLAVRSVIPMAGREITGNEFPAELGLDEWAVDFHKGCYLGQEIVSRIESVGRVKRSLRAASSASFVGQGSEVRNAVGTSGRVTRNFSFSDERLYSGLVLFEQKARREQPVEFEHVTPS